MDKVKILCVDDEENVLKLYKELFRNHEIITETSSVGAAELIKSENFDIFIVDYQMAGMNGIDLLKKIKEEYKNKDYVLLLATAYGTIHLFKSELVNGLFDYFIEKPFELQAIKKIISKAFINLGKKKNKTIQLEEDTESEI